jgi:hypothetical protein
MEFMKNMLIKTICILAMSFSPSLSYADQDGELNEGSCSKILDACKTFIKNKKNSKVKLSLYRNCMQPLLNNEKVSGVTIEAEVIKECQAKKAEIKQKK